MIFLPALFFEIAQMLSLQSFMNSIQNGNFSDYETKTEGDLVMLFSEKDRLINGTIIDSRTGELVHHSFPKSFTGLVGPDSFAGDLANAQCIPLYEGSLIRIYWYENAWKIGTSKCIDATFSNWGTEMSFKELFLEAVGDNHSTFSFDKLDKDYCYSFTLQHPEIKIGLDITDTRILPINKIHRKTFIETDTSGLKRVPFSGIKPKYYYENYLIFTKCGNRVSFLTEEYVRLQELMNNNPSMKWTYIEALQKNQEKMLDFYFPSERDLFYGINRDLDIVSDLVQKEYYNRHVLKNKEYKFNGLYNKLIYQLHGNYIKTKKKTDNAAIKNFLLTQETGYLFHLLEEIC